MRKAVLPAVCVLLSICAAQVFETTVALPDSLGPLRPPCRLITDASGLMLYAASESSDVIALEAPSLRRLGRITTNSPVTAACLSARQNELYFACLWTNSVLVVEGSSGRLLDSLSVSYAPADLCYDQEHDKVYCASYCRPVMSVIDCQSHAVVEETLPGIAYCLAIHPSLPKLYLGCINPSSIVVIDTRTDTAISTVRLELDPYAFCFAGRANKLYAAAANSITSLDASSDTILQTITGIGTAPLRMTYGEFMNQLSCIDSTGEWVAFIDASADTFCGSVSYPHSFFWGAEFSKDDSTVFAGAQMGPGSYSYIGLLDRQANRLDGQLYVGMRDGTLCYDSGRDVLYAAGDMGSICAVDCRLDSVVGVSTLCSEVHQLRYAPGVDKVYFSQYDSRKCISAVDPSTNRVTALMPVGAGLSFCYNRTSHKLYVPTEFAFGSDCIAVYDALGDSLLTTMPLERVKRMVWDSVHNKLYCLYNSNETESGVVLMFDGVGDTLLKRIDLLSQADWLVWIPEYGKLYASGVDLTTVIDCATDSIVDELPVHLPASDVCYAADEGKVYFASGEVVRVVDVRRDSLADSLRRRGWVQTVGGNLLYARGYHRLYWNRCYDNSVDSVDVIDTRSDSIIRALRVTYPLTAMCFDSLAGQVYLACLYDTFLSVIDCVTDRIDGTVRLPNSLLWSLVLSPEQHRLYVGCRQGLMVVRTDSMAGLASPATSGAERLAFPTLLRRFFVLPPGQTARLVDVTGRRVAVLVPGRNDLAGLPPGAYFLVEDGLSRKAKVLMLR